MRRAILAALILISAACSADPAPTSAPTPAPASASQTTPVVTPAPVAAFAKLEKQYAARLGVYALDTGTNRTVAYRAGERFAFASTFKALAAGVLIAQGKNLDKLIRYSESDLLANSPITKKHVRTGMTLRQLCDAAIRYSDNAAANLMLTELGGPSGFQAGLRKLGDNTTRSDRNEPTLSEGAPGDPRDTTTPQALATTLQKLALGNALPPPGRALLINWLQNNTTGATTIRAGVPKTWKVGDKTGTAGYGGRNNVAILWPPNRPPIILAIMSTKGTKNAEQDDKLIASAAAAAVASLG